MNEIVREPEHLCPIWVGHLLASPVRRLMHNPEKILSPYIQPGMQVLDAGSAMGFFSVPAAKMVGEKGKVICVDCQPGMFVKLKKRAARYNVLPQIETRACGFESLGIEDLAGQIDVAMAIAIIHETPKPVKTVRDIVVTLKPGGKMMVAEPNGHVSDSEIAEIKDIGLQLGLRRHDGPVIKGHTSFVFEKENTGTVMKN